MQHDRTTGTGTTETMGGGDDRPGLDQLRERADQVRGSAADTLESAARRVDAFAEMLPERGLSARAGNVGHGAADTLESVARFLRDHDIDTLQHDLGRLVGSRPLTMLLLAVGAGFAVGRALR